MRLPKMILFDYGQTLVNERRFDGVAGTEAILKHATKNKYNRTATEVDTLTVHHFNELQNFCEKALTNE